MENRGPEWLRKLLGDKWGEWLVPVTSIRFGSRTTDTDLECLKWFWQVEKLNLDFTKITDDGLAQVKGLVQLRTLEMWDTKITDAGLENLKSLTQLQGAERVGYPGHGRWTATPERVHATSIARPDGSQRHGRSG